jgi:hypothetical protein
MIARPPTLARAPMPALVLVLRPEVGCTGYWVEYGVSVVGTSDGVEDRVSVVDPATVGVTLWSGAVPNPLRTA